MNGERDTDTFLDDETPESPPSPKESDDDVFVLLILLPLRLLAAVPGMLGSFWLLRNGVVLALKNQDLRRVGDRRDPGSLDFLVSCLWVSADSIQRIISTKLLTTPLQSLSTAFHALSFTTLLLRRWLVYYSLVPSLIRLLALQSICWPLVRLTLYVFGPQQPLAAWIVIATTTAFSDVVARWVTSNIADMPLPDSDGDDSGASNGLLRRSGRGLEKGSSRFFKLVMGDPGQTALEDSEETDESDKAEEDDLLGEFRAADAALAGLNSFTAAGEGNGGPSSNSDRAIALTRARARAAARAVNARHNAKVRKVRRRAARRRMRARIQKMQITSRRVFHWDVAVRRNVIPLFVLSYLTVWILLIDGM